MKLVSSSPAQQPSAVTAPVVPSWKRWLAAGLATLSVFYIFTVFCGYSFYALAPEEGHGGRGRAPCGSELGGIDEDIKDDFLYLLVSDIPTARVPGCKKGIEGGSEDDKRIIVVGDVHGMFDEFEELLSKMDFDSRRDYLVLAGDIISKGPHSLKVVDLARKIGAHCVRGNHEDKILIHYHDIRRKKNGQSDDSRSTLDESFDDSERGEDADQRSAMAADRKLAKSLSRTQAEWLDACPLVVRAKSVPSMGKLLIVHAGLVHGISLESQDPTAIMTMRTLDKRTHIPSPSQGGMHWAKFWNRKERAEGQPEDHTTVVYGHYAAKGLDIRKYTKGLDSNCVRGGRLSAYILEAKKGGGVKEKVVSVKCQKHLD